MLPTIKIAPTDNPALLSVRFEYSATVVNLVRGIPGANYIQTAKCWAIPAASLAAAVKQFRGVRCELDPRLAPPPEEVPAAWKDPTLDGELTKAIDARHKFVLKPFAHQRVAMELAVKHKSFAFLMEMGTGKTKATIDWANWLINEKLIGGALVVCPKAMLHTWKREIDTHSAEKRNTTVMVGSTADKLEAMRAGRHVSHFFVTNYAALRSDALQFGGLVHSRKLAVILDESNNIANHRAEQTKAIHALRDLAQYKLILTGTPIANSPLDAFSQFFFLDPRILGHMNFTSFRSEYAILGGFRGKEITGYKNVERLQQRIASRSYRVLKRDCLDLPEKMYRTVDVDPGPKMTAAYRTLKEEAVLEVGEHVVAAPIVLTRMMRLQQITSGFLPVHDEFGKEIAVEEYEPVKLDAMDELIEEAVSQGRKVIVWARFVHDVKRACARAAKHGAVMYHGEVSDKLRQEAVDKFQTDPNTRVFVGQSHTGGIGITLTAATVEIYLSNSFSYLDRAQSEDRAHRIGQRSNVDIIDIVVRGTIDEYVTRTLRDKKDIAALITGDNVKEMFGAL